MEHYKTLGVDKNATQEDIKKAYRKLAGQYHPDKGGDTATFQKIQAAYDILGDPEKRKQYDHSQVYGSHNFWANDFPNGFSMFGDAIDPREIFAHIFGQRGQNFHHHQQIFRTMVSITLEDAYNGKSQILQMQTPLGQKVITIDIPKGIKENAHIKYENILEGASLLVEFKILPHLKFERRGNDLYCNQPISVLDLIVGTKLNVTTISGKMFEVTVPPKTQPNMQLKVNGQGMPIQGTTVYGDQILLLKPFIPDTISDSIIQSILNSKQQ